MNVINPKCDVCDKPATSWVVDVIRYPNFATGFLEERPIEPARYGCDEHPPKEAVFDFIGLPLQ
jgi:hypothetical protein